MDYSIADVPMTAYDYHMWQLLGFCAAGIAIIYCLALNNRAILEARAMQLAYLCKQRTLHLQDRGHAGTLGTMPLLEKPMTRRRRRQKRLRLAAAQMLLPLLAMMGEPVTLPSKHTVIEKGNRR